MDDRPVAQDSGVHVRHRLRHALQDFMGPAGFLEGHFRLHQFVQGFALDIFQEEAMRRGIIRQFRPDAGMRYFIQHVGFIRNKYLIPEIPRFLEQRRPGISGKLHFGEF